MKDIISNISMHATRKEWEYMGTPPFTTWNVGLWFRMDFFTRFPY